MGALLLAVAASLTRPGWAAGEFVKNLHKAESRKDPVERVEYLDRAIKAWEPGNGTPLLSHALLLRGESRYWQLEHEAAEPDLTKAIELDPGTALAYGLRGRIQLRRGKLAEASRDLREFTALKSEDIDGWVRLGEAYTKAGSLDEALRALRRAEQLDPADWRAAHGLARVSMAAKRWNEGLERLASAASLAKGKTADILVDRAVCLVALGRPEQALKDYGEALPLHDLLVSQLSRGNGRRLEAVEAQEKAARAYFGRGRVNQFLAQIRPAHEDYSEACRLGHEQACAKAAELAELLKKEPERKPVENAELEPPAAEEPRPAPKPRRRRAPPPDSDTGDRIYAN
jgi:tetratricopeptide (TPR) repeat protein